MTPKSRAAAPEPVADKKKKKKKGNGRGKGSTTGEKPTNSRTVSRTPEDAAAIRKKRMDRQLAIG